MSEIESGDCNIFTMIKIDSGDCKILFYSSLNKTTRFSIWFNLKLFKVFNIKFLTIKCLQEGDLRLLIILFIYNLILDCEQLVENLQNITHRFLVDETRADIIEWLARHGFIHNCFNCPNCKSLCRLNSWNRTKDKKIWRCRSQNCNFTKSIRADSLFEKSHLILT